MNDVTDRFEQAMADLIEAAEQVLAAAAGRALEQVNASCLRVDVHRYDGVVSACALVGGDRVHLEDIDGIDHRAVDRAATFWAFNIDPGAPGAQQDAFFFKPAKSS